MPRSARLYKGCVTGHRSTYPFGNIGVDWILGEKRVVVVVVVVILVIIGISHIIATHAGREGVISWEGGRAGGGAATEGGEWEMGE